MNFSGNTSPCAGPYFYELNACTVFTSTFQPLSHISGRSFGCQVVSISFNSTSPLPTRKQNETHFPSGPFMQKARLHYFPNCYLITY